MLSQVTCIVRLLFLQISKWHYNYIRNTYTQPTKGVLSRLCRLELVESRRKLCHHDHYLRLKKTLCFLTLFPLLAEFCTFTELKSTKRTGVLSASKELPEITQATILGFIYLFNLYKQPTKKLKLSFAVSSFSSPVKLASLAKADLQHPLDKT